MALAADVVLGLMAKIEQVFAGPEMDLGDDTFLSFPATSVIALPAAHLADLGRPSPTTQAAQSAADFAHIVNAVPRGRLWRQAAGPRLWDVLGSVMAEAEVAEVSSTEAERAEADAARDLLYDTGEDGSTTESEALLTYRQHRDAWFVAQAEHANRRGPAELAGGEELERFREVEEPQLRAAVAEIEVAWEVAGRRSEIEAAQRTLRTMNERSPAAAWASFLSRFDPSMPDLSLYTGPDGARYGPTGLLPASVAETSWPTISLDRAQLDALAAAADDELRRSLGSDRDPSVVGVSFEYTSTSLQRPWFSPELFDARYWRLPPGAQELSDGADRPEGRCPAYVTAVALARNIVVRRTAQASEGGAQRRDLGFLGGAHLRAVAAATPPEVRVTRAREAAGTATAAVRDHRTAAAAPNVRVAAVRDPGQATVRDHRSSPSARLTMQAPLIARLRLNDVLIVPPRPVPVEPAGEVTTEETPPDEVFVLAFIAKRLARCPDPDPKLFPSAAVDRDDPLSAEAARKALAYDERQGYAEAEIELIQRVVGVAVDGTWSSSTVQAVARWQRTNGIPVDGKVRRHPDGDTWPPIQAAAASMA